MKVECMYYSGATTTIWVIECAVAAAASGSNLPQDVYITGVN